MGNANLSRNIETFNVFDLGMRFHILFESVSEDFIKISEKCSYL